MSSTVYFSSMEYDQYVPEQSLPARFGRMLDGLKLAPAVKGKWVAIKMHLGRHIGYSTIPPLFVKILVDKLREAGANVFITDQDIHGGENRGYTEAYFGVPIVAACGVTGRYLYEKKVKYRTFKNVDIAGNIHDADAMIVLSHVKGHGACGYGGACKNIAMGCVTDRTRQQIHGLEGGIEWDEEACKFCELCVQSCEHHANKFQNRKYEVFFHHCTYCQHCVKVCPKGALKVHKARYNDFQAGMALCTEEVLKVFEPKHVFYINVLLQLTALCDCWGFTTPSLVPDIGIMASTDMVAIERASLDSIKVENLIPAGVPQGMTLKPEGHLLERLHGKDPFVQLRELEKRGLGSQEYRIEKVG